MNTGHLQLSRPPWALLVLVAALGSTSVWAAGKASQSDVQARYQQERAVCLSGQSNQDRATCLREAGAALAEARHDGLNDGSAQYLRNARARCARLPEDDRQACLARMQGQGTTSGSAAAGGIYRELVLREVITPSAAEPEAVAK